MFALRGVQCAERFSRDSYRSIGRKQSDPTSLTTKGENMPTKKASSKKTAAKKKPSAAAALGKAKLNFALTPEKVAAIQRCLAKGKLTVTVNKADLAKGRIGDAWLYD